jgi:hypothetical protein
MVRRYFAASALWLAACLTFLGALAVAPAADDFPRTPPQKEELPRAIPDEDFDMLCRLIRPSDGESRWAQIPWLVSVYEARKKAAEAGKPILIWSAGGSAPIGGC